LRHLIAFHRPSEAPSVQPNRAHGPQRADVAATVKCGTERARHSTASGRPLGKAVHGVAGAGACSQCSSAAAPSSPLTAQLLRMFLACVRLPHSQAAARG